MVEIKNKTLPSSNMWQYYGCGVLKNATLRTRHRLFDTRSCTRIEHNVLNYNITSTDRINNNYTDRAQ